MTDTSNTTPIDETLPEIVQEFLRKGYQLEQITLHADGHWTHKGQPFENPKIIKLFNYSVARTKGGTWVIDVGQFVYPITVEDCGYFVERLALHEDGITLYLSDGTEEPLDIASLTYKEGGRLYCQVKSNAFTARFKRAPYHGLSDYMDVDGDMIVFKYQDHIVALAKMEDVD